jgi:hypothetical protein
MSPNLWLFWEAMKKTILKTELLVEDNIKMEQQSQ